MRLAQHFGKWIATAAPSTRVSHEESFMLRCIKTSLFVMLFSCGKGGGNENKAIKKIDRYGFV